jgi:hypothetical protein
LFVAFSQLDAFPAVLIALDGSRSPLLLERRHCFPRQFEEDGVEPVDLGAGHSKLAFQLRDVTVDIRKLTGVFPDGFVLL